MWIKPTQKDMDNKYVEEDFERLSELDKMWLLEKDREMFTEWQQWTEEQENKRLPAVIKMQPIPKLHRHED